jgi:hypothetical protein
VTHGRRHVGRHTREGTTPGDNPLSPMPISSVLIEDISIWNAHHNCLVHCQCSLLRNSTYFHKICNLHFLNRLPVNDMINSNMEPSVPMVPVTPRRNIFAQLPQLAWDFQDRLLVTDTVDVQSPSLTLPNFAFERRRLFQRLLCRYLRLTLVKYSPRLIPSNIGTTDRF